MAATQNSSQLPSISLTRKHAVRCSNIDGVSVESYVEAIAREVGDSQIVAASRMNHSVVVFLKTIGNVESVSASGVSIGHRFVSVEPFVRPATKLILSNVPPFLPSIYITNSLAQYGRVVSNLRPIPLGCKRPSLKHVISFRRQVYIFLCSENINGLMPVEYEGRVYNLYVSTDEMKCFQCGSQSHIRRNCPENNRQVNDTHTENEITNSGSVSQHTEPDLTNQSTPLDNGTPVQNTESNVVDNQIENNNTHAVNQNSNVDSGENDAIEHIDKVPSVPIQPGYGPGDNEPSVNISPSPEKMDTESDPESQPSHDKQTSNEKETVTKQTTNEKETVKKPKSTAQCNVALDTIAEEKMLRKTDKQKVSKVKASTVKNRELINKQMPIVQRDVAMDIINDPKMTSRTGKQTVLKQTVSNVDDGETVRTRPPPPGEVTHSLAVQGSATPAPGPPPAPPPPLVPHVSVVRCTQGAAVDLPIFVLPSTSEIDALYASPLPPDSNTSNCSQDLFYDTVPSLSVVPDSQPDITSNLEGKVMDDDMESIASDTSEMSQVAGDSPSANISNTSIAEFLENTKYSKKFIENCFDFTPNIRDFSKQLFKYRNTQPLSPLVKSRITKLINKIKTHIKTTGRFMAK